MRDKQSLHKSISTTNTSRIWTIVLLIIFYASPAFESRVSAGVIVTFQESGGNVTATANGTLNLTSLTFTGTVAEYSYVEPIGPEIGVGPAVFPTTIANDAYIGNTISPPFGPGLPGASLATSGTGSEFGESTRQISVPIGYTSGSQLAGTATWTGQTFASLGLTPGTYTSTWGTGPTADFFTVIVGGQAVPEPPSLWLALIGSVGIFAHWQFGRRKTQKRQGPEGSHGAAE